MGARPRVLIAGALVAACGDPAEPPSLAPTPALERAISTELGARLGVPVGVRCVAPLGTVVACRGLLPDGRPLPIALRDVGSAWDWSIDRRMIAAAPLEAYVAEVLQDLGAPQAATCGSAVLELPADDRVECHLARGGRAFVAVGSDGTLAVEVQLDPAAAAARGEPVSGARASELDGLSRALAPGSDGE